MSATTPTPAAAPDDAKEKTSDDDSLGYDAYAKTLWVRIEQALNRDDGNDERGSPKVLGDDPLVVGIFGEWGAGKSYLLNKIRAHAFGYSNARVIARQGDSGFGLTIPVFFQPWKYEHEEHLHVPLLMHILLALKQDLKRSQTPFEQANQWLDKYGDKLAPQMKVVVDSFEKILNATAVMTAPATAGASLAAIPLMSLAKALAAKLPGFKRVLPNVLTGVRYTDEGRYYYEIHEHLKAITRPAGKENAERGYKLGLQVDNQYVAINFVIFIDDLDRCLPEKAVEVLELIKTIFNAESFAFVLALDDEVIERGIGHRYRDYALGNKKSEMPITGFEYLEKIVHLPFRLPALTREDALRFIKQKEQKLLDSVTPELRATYQPQSWFSGVQVGQLSSSGGESVPTLQLSHLLVNSFDAYLPRKLDRAVALFHHVAKVAAERGRPLGVSAGETDVRIVLAIVLIQLFQPELFRCLRRTGTGFDQLRNAFRPDANNDTLLSSRATDYELLDWACYGPDLRAESAALARMKDSLRASLTSVPTSETEGGQVNHLAVRNKAARLPTSLAATSAVIANLEKSQRHSSQRVRLPIVEKMLEHRATQRHAFDVLKLFASLQESAALMPLSDESVKPYFSWLALTVQTDTRERLPLLEVVAVPAPAPDNDQAVEPDATDDFVEISNATSQTKVSTVLGASARRVRIPEISSVFDLFTSLEPREQAEVVNRAGLLAGQIIDSKSAADLRSRVENWLSERSGSSSSPGETGKKQILLHGLQYVAPHLAPEDAAAFWALVADSVVLPTEPNELVEKPELAALYGDVRAALGFDTRFDEKRPYLHKEKFPGNTYDDEPLPGFVRIPAGAFTLGHEEEKDNQQRKNFRIGEPFYIARMLTTVAQYSRFVDGKGYQADADLWGAQGMEWRTGAFDSKNESKAYKDHLAKRTPDLRTKPWDWDAQLANVSRPVTGISWFEARAYARWLSGQLRETLEERGLNGYQVMLPTEPQWERAARAKNLTGTHEGRWPWGDEAKSAPQRANIQASGIDDVSPVGVFAPSAIGLYDMAGNVREWMDNRYESFPSETIVRVERDATPGGERRSLRGGSWFDLPEDASCSSRLRLLPDDSNYFIGLRVVLSLAKSERET